MPGVASKNIDVPTKEESAEQKQAALAFPEHPSHATESSDTDGNTRPEVLPTPNWEMWKTRGACRIWKAVLISMAVKPTSTVLKRLKKEQPLRYTEYIRRRKDVVAQYGLHPELQVAKHLNEGEKPGQQYIKLRGLLNFAKEYRWKDLDAFEQGMKLSAPPSAAARTAHALFDALPQGQRHALVRTGALLQLLEDVLKKGTELHAASLLHGGKLNISQVASRVEKIIGNASDQDKVENFEKEANRKQFGEAQQALRSHV